MHPIHRQPIPGFAMLDKNHFLGMAARAKKTSILGHSVVRQSLNMDRRHGGSCFLCAFFNRDLAWSAGKIFTNVYTVILCVTIFYKV